MLFAAGSAHGQGTLIGKIVYEEDGEQKPLYGANIWWEDSDVGTTTLEDGTFEIEYVSESNILNVSFVGFKRIRQPIEGRPKKIPPLIMEEGDLLQAVEVREVIRATEINTKSVSLTYEINKKELRKAACCNVAESFETNPAVDVSFSDAITGTKRIEMLGLSGKYAPVQMENIPFGRGLATMTGLTFLPGPWVENIHLSKGVGSVVNGFESTTGLIDVELTGPAMSERTHINAYVNSGGRNELNFVNVKKHNDTWSSAHLLHGSSVPIRWDVNDNGFIDMPLSAQLNGVSRWRYTADNWQGQFGAHYIYNRNRGGQTDYDFTGDKDDDHWGMEVENKRFSVFSKTAYLFDGDRQSSVGLIANAFTHRQDAFFGRQDLFGQHDGVYLNLIYQNGSSSSGESDCDTPKDKFIFQSGLSMQYDNVETILTDNRPGQFYSNNSFIPREEIVSGVFGETQWKPSDKFDAVGGIRADYSNIFGTFFTPRLHLRYEPQENWIIRGHGGASRRAPLPIQENLNVLGSNRFFSSQRNFAFSPGGRDAGLFPLNFMGGISPDLEQERAWNFGLSLQHEFRLFYRKGSIVLDGFYTHFDNQLVVDMDYHPEMFRLYYGEGGFSRGAMFQIDYEVWRRFDVRMAYKFLDVRQPFEESGLRESPLISPHRAFVNLEYETHSKWGFDLTVNWFSSQRLPDTHLSPEVFQLDTRSPSFFILNTQVRKDVNNKLSLFLGIENLLDFRQENPIVNAANPDRANFDASMIWGPIFGRMAYLRMDYTF